MLETIIGLSFLPFSCFFGASFTDNYFDFFGHFNPSSFFIVFFEQLASNTLAGELFSPSSSLSLRCIVLVTKVKDCLPYCNR